MDLKEEEILGDAVKGHWYYVAKGRALRQFLGGIWAEEVLDVGAGSGIFAKQLLENRFSAAAICVDHGYTEDRAAGHGGKPVAFLREVKDVKQKLVLMMDVLEHVENDVALLKKYMPPPGGYVMISVPAFPFLWSGHDVFLEHKRRYTRWMLEDAVAQAGLEIVRLRYFFGLLFPVVAVMRLVKNRLLNRGKIEAKSELAVCPPWLNKALVLTHDIERFTLFPWNKLAGLSIFCLCRRP